MREFLVGLVVLCGVVAVPSKAAEETETLWRFDFANDMFADSDNLFSAGWSVQWHPQGAASWEDLGVGRTSALIARVIPGLEPAEGLEVRRGYSISQVIQTPEDLSQTELIEDDVPYAGALGWSTAWTALNDKKLNSFQFYIGVLGPNSYAEEVQTFVHVDLGFGEEPMGWDNQLGNELLLNVNYALARKLVGFGNQDRFGGDLSVGGELALGNLFTHAQAGVGLRAGWNLPGGFAPVPDMAGRGMALDTTLHKREDAWRIYGTLIGRGTAVAYTALLDGNLNEDSHSVEYDPSLAQLVAGLHVERGGWAAHFTMFLSEDPKEENAKSDLTWGNLSFQWTL